MASPKIGDTITHKGYLGTVTQLLSAQFVYYVDGCPLSRFAMYTEDWKPVKKDKPAKTK